MISSNILPLEGQPTPILEVLARLGTGDFTARGDATGQGAADDALIHGINQLATILQQQHATIMEIEQRGEDLLDVMLHLARLDYSRRATVTAGDSVFDALGTGLNMLVDELVAAQVSQARLQEEIIQSQAAVIQELSTPLIPISDDILVMPLIGNIDTARAQHVMERVLEGVAAHHAETIILDITGVAVVDTQVANTLLRTAQAVQLLGTQVMVTGIRPEVAQTLVNLGVDFRRLQTWSTMQMGIAAALQHTSHTTRFARR